MRAHPRSRGENPLEWAAPTARWGSSPLTRGKPRRASPTASCTGLIPAHAGKTASAGARSEAVRAHPRSRGENAEIGVRTPAAKGSSPLTRGKLTCPDEQLIKLGLIPAHAGKTPAPSPAGTGGGAHPRSRGENALTRGAGRRFSGSSPLTRGKLHDRRPAMTTAGLIPAHAGKTLCPSR